MIRTLPGARLIAFACVIALASTARAQNDRNQSAVIITDIEGRDSTAKLRAFASDSITVDAGAVRELPTNNLLRLKLRNAGPTPEMNGPQILFANGDRIAAKPTGMDGERLIVAWGIMTSGPTVQIPLETIRAFLPAVPRSAAARSSLLALVLGRKETQDVVLLRNGDRVGGEITSLSETAVTLKTSVGDTVIELPGLQAATFNPNLVSFPKSEGMSVLLTLADGSRLTVKPIELGDNGSLRAHALFGAEMAIPLTSILEARFLGGRAVYLSDLEPAGYRFTPFLQTQWPLNRDRNVVGGPLLVDGIEYAKGLGVHSRSAIEYRLDGQYQRFMAHAGLDDAAGDKGSVVFAVDVDGHRVATSPIQTSASPAYAVGPIDLTGKTKITLHVDFGPLGDIQDHADWCDAVLIKAR